MFTHSFLPQDVLAETPDKLWANFIGDCVHRPFSLYDSAVPKYPHWLPAGSDPLSTNPELLRADKYA